jgi:hypothetical protein
MATKTATMISATRINLKAAFLALPEYFMCTQGTALTAGVKIKTLADQAAAGQDRRCEPIHCIPAPPWKLAKTDVNLGVAS